MADQIKPRYRLGCQFHLDLAKDDATKIPESTLFRFTDSNKDEDFIQHGDIVVRAPRYMDDESSVRFKSVDSDRFGFAAEFMLQPLI